MLDLQNNKMGRLFEGMLDLMFPPSCMLCDTLLPTNNRTGLCSQCRDSLWSVHPPFCRICGTPFEQGELSRVCKDCFESPPEFDMLRTPYAYLGSLRQAVIQFKFHRITRYAKPLGSLLAASAGLGVNWRDYDMAMPVPLHPERIRERGFNQSVILARIILQGSGVPIKFDVLHRVKSTIPQTGLTGTKRRENVRGAFGVSERALVAGRSILLVDDIVTTGSTINACAKALKKAGAKRVDAVAVARPVEFAE